MKNLLYPVLLATTIMAASCTNNQDDVTEVTDPSNKTAISFVGQDNSRLGTRYGFEGSAESYTQIAMHIRSNKNGGSSTDVRETRTLVKAEHDATKTVESVSEIKSLGDSYTRYWDDAYGRDAQLSVFAIAVPGKSSPSNASKDLEAKLEAVKGNKTWSTDTLSEKVSWTVSTTQTSDLIDNEDLTYSNNISSSGLGGVKSSNSEVTDGYLKFRLNSPSATGGPGKFDQGILKFNHALSRITVKLVKGTGFGEGSFNFKDGTNVTILNVPTSGKLDIKAGKWEDVTTSNITKMYNAATGNSAACSLLAQMLPGYKITDGDNTNVLEFVIDDNKYFITKDMMYDALPASEKTGGSPITMTQGTKYNFTITVNKSKIINVTATLEPWSNVTAEDQTIDNAHIALNFYNNTSGTAITKKTFDLYRLNDGSDNINTGVSAATNWGGHYTDKATLTYANNKWETNWFFEDNKSFYHFRSVNENIKIKESNTDTNDYFVITSGAQDGNDYHWGAPIKKDATITYSTSNGYADIISPAIGATNSAINMTELHMMSNINVVLRTTTSTNAVALEDASKNQCVVTLTYFYKDGTVNMGNGLVKTTGDLDDGKNGVFSAPATGIAPDGTGYIETNPFTFAVVPQALKRTGEGDHLYVGITIKTPDNNQYYVVEKLSDIIAKTNGGSQNQTASNKIDFWYPNHSYTYTFTITKAGISNVICTVEKWKEVTADNQNISLEN